MVVRAVMLSTGIRRAPTNCTSTISRYGQVACKYSGVCHGQCEPGRGLAHVNWVASLWVCCSVWSGAMGYEPEESPWTPVDDAPFLFIRTTRVARNGVRYSGLAHFDRLISSPCLSTFYVILADVQNSGQPKFNQ